MVPILPPIVGEPSPLARAPSSSFATLTTAASFLARTLLDVFAPLGCASCDDPRPRDLAFCARCDETLLREPLQGSALGPAGKSRGLVLAPVAVRVHAFGAYGAALAEAIVRFKYAGRSDLAQPLGALLASLTVDCGLSPDVVVPVPLHPLRLMRRGYNQSALLAACVARRACAALDTSSLRRSRPAPAQAGLGAAARERNLVDAFAAGGHALRGRRVLLVDDVMTTGATLRACARAVVRSGASHVSAIVLARAL